jgi:hypothetical protein
MISKIAFLTRIFGVFQSSNIVEMRGWGKIWNLVKM